MNELMLREHRLPEQAAMYLYAAYHLGASQQEVHAAANATTGDCEVNRKMGALDFLLAQGVHMTGIGALAPQQYLMPEALMYLTRAWDTMGVEYSEELANVTLANIQLEVVAFLEVIAKYDGQYHHEERPATPGDITQAFAQNGIVLLETWRSGMKGTKGLALGCEHDEYYVAYLPSSDLLHYSLREEVNANMWPVITTLSRM